jgi:two-component sensor histidine kinase
VKHAFPGGEEGVVRITLRREGERLSLEVNDNGQGLPSSLDLDTAESMGFTLMKLLAGQLGGTLSVESAGGTSVAVSFGF